MAAYISNIVIDAGADFNQTYNLENSANAPLDLSGYTATSVLKKHPASLNNTASFSCSFPNRAQGQLKISLGSTLTTPLKWPGLNLPHSSLLLMSKKMFFLGINPYTSL